MALKNMLFWGTALILAIIAGGCSTSTSVQNEMKKVTDVQVKAFQNQKTEKKLDIFVPLKEQYASSKHTQSLQTLLKSKNVKPTCYQCMSTEYFLAPTNQKPDPKNVKLSITCAVCHDLTAKDFKLRTNPLDTCTGCHHSAGVITPGAKVNHPQKEMFLGYGAIGVPPTPDSKYKAGLTCIECHMPNESHNFEGLTPAKAIRQHKGSICVMCHSDQSEEQFAKKVEDMQLNIKKTCDQLAKSLTADDKKIKANRQRGINVDQAQTVYNVIYTNLSFVQSDKSMGVHNFEYTTRILNYSKIRQQELEKLLK